MVNLDLKTLGHCELNGKLLCYTAELLTSRQSGNRVRKRQLPQDKAQ